jgi:hypothetical protein
MMTRISSLNGDLASYRDKLSTKSDELAAALALPRDDPQLHMKLHDLESANSDLRAQIDTANQKLTRAKEEIFSLQEASLNSGEQLQELENKLSDAQNTIKNSAEEKIQLLAISKLDIEKLRQDVSKAASASKSEMVMRHECVVKNLERRQAEAESQARFMKEELQRVRDEKAGYVNSTSELQSELSTQMENVARLTAQLNQLESQSVSQDDFDRQRHSGESARRELTELRTFLEDARNKAEKNLTAARQSTAEVEIQLRRVHDLERENTLLQEQNDDLQKKYDALSALKIHHQPVQQPASLQMGPLGRSSESSQPSPQPDLDIGTPRASDEDERIPRPHLFRRPANASLLGVHPAGDRRQPGSKSSVSQANEATVMANGPSFGVTPNTVRVSSFKDVPNSLVLGHAELNAEHVADQTPKPLKPANRKASTIIQRPGTEDQILSENKSAGYSSGVTRSLREETTICIQASTNGITPHFAMTPIGSSQVSNPTSYSPLIEKIAEIHSQEALRFAYATNRVDKLREARVDHNPAMKTPATHQSSQKPMEGPSRNGIPPNEDNEFAVINTNKPSFPVTASDTNRAKYQIPRKPSVPRSDAKPLKSALKRACSKSTVEPEPETDVAEPASTAKPATLQKGMVAQLSKRGPQKTQQQAEPKLPRDQYHRVASGGNRAAQSESSRHAPVAQNRSRLNQNHKQVTEESPPMTMSRKRSASGLGQGVANKRLRLSFAPKKTIRKVIPGSQEVIPDSQPSQETRGRQCYRY